MSKKYHLTVVRTEETIVGGEVDNTEYTEYHITVSPQNYNKVKNMTERELADLIGLKDFNDSPEDFLQLYNGNENTIDADERIENFKEKTFKFWWREYRIVEYEGNVKAETMYDAEKVLKNSRSRVENIKVTSEGPAKNIKDYFKIIDRGEIK